jgi:hypothetical protein
MGTANFTVEISAVADLNGAPKAHLQSHLEQAVFRAIGDGMLTGHTEVELDEYQSYITMDRHDLEGQIATHFETLLKDETLDVTMVSKRMAHYALTLPSDFINHFQSGEMSTGAKTSPETSKVPQEDGNPFTVDSVLYAAAAREGWSIFDCEDSANGRWQVQSFDTPEDLKKIAGKIPDNITDREAWILIMTGNEAHHIAARAFIKQANPQEFGLMLEAVNEDADER